jgi:hypothetical protein
VVAEDPDGSINTRNQSVVYETGLSYKQQYVARQHLRERGLLNESYDRPAHLTWFQLNMTALREALGEVGDLKEDEEDRVPERKHRYSPAGTPVFPNGRSLKGTCTDYTQTTAERPAATEKTRFRFANGPPHEIPATPFEAMQHPMIKLFGEVCGRMPGMRDYRVVIEAMQHFREREGAEAVPYLKPFWMAWSSRKRRSDGKPYDPSSLTWLTEWALNGSIPAEIGGSHEHGSAGRYEPRPLTEAELATAEIINRENRREAELWRSQLPEMRRSGLPAS